MEELARDLCVWSGDELQNAAELHYRAVWIHPFIDGNGRWARLIANIWLAQKRLPLVMWPQPELRVVESPLRKEYIQAILQWESGYMEAFVELHRRFIDPSPISSSPPGATR
jgi:Fic family protein